MNTKRTFKIALVERHGIFRDAIRGYLEREDDFVVCFAASSCSGVLEKVGETKPDVLLLSASSTNANALLLLRMIRDEYQWIKIAAYSQDQHEFAHAERIAALGAQALFCRTDDGRAFIRGIRGILRGEKYVCREMAAFARRRGRLERLESIQSDPIDVLSDREFAVFQLTGLGYPISEMAERLQVKDKTIATFMRRARKKLDIKESSRFLQCAIAYMHCDSTECREGDSTTVTGPR